MITEGSHRTETAPLYVVLPGGVDDAASPSGGNHYDRQVCDGLAGGGRTVHEIAVRGDWPHPDAAARAELARSLAELPDGSLVLMDGLVGCGVPDVVEPHAARLHLVVLVHLPLADETGLDSGTAARLDALERRTLHAATAVIATSSWAARRLVHHHGLDGDRVHVVTPGTAGAPVAPGTDGASGLLCVASLTPRKGQDLLVEALASVVDLPWTCVLAGPLDRDPAYVARLRRLAVRHGMGERVRFAGPLSGGALEAAYAAADLMVLASRAETYGMVITEALARGIPVLATEVDAVPDTLGRDQVGGVPGILVPREDPGALADALRGWLGDDDLRRRLRNSALLRRRMLLPWDRTSWRVAAVLDGVAAGAGGPR